MIEATSPIVFDRSRRIDAERCRRLRWWAYEYKGRGVQRVSLSIAPLIGQLLHTGIEQLIKGNNIDDVIISVLLQLSIQTARAGTVPDFYEGQDPRELLEEQAALLEGILRAWAAVRLQPFLDEYEPLSVEREEQAHFHYQGHKLVLLTRADALVRRRSDGTLLLWNWKSVSQADRVWRQQWALDQQTLSEVLAVEQRLAEEDVSSYDSGVTKLGGVVIEGLLKGKRLEYPEGSGRYYHNSPLTQAWHRQGERPFLLIDEWHAKYTWQDASGQSHRLSKGFHKVAVWKDYPGGVKSWIAHLAATDQQLLVDQFLVLPVIKRNDAAVKDWVEQTLHDELLIHQNAAYINSNNAADMLNKFFPQSTGSNCLRPSTCPMYEVCWGAAGIEPEATGQYVLREPNHPAEAELRNWRSHEVKAESD